MANRSFSFPLGAMIAGLVRTAQSAPTSPDVKNSRRLWTYVLHKISHCSLNACDPPSDSWATVGYRGTAFRNICCCYFPQAPAAQLATLKVQRDMQTFLEAFQNWRATLNYLLYSTDNAHQRERYRIKSHLVRAIYVPQNQMTEDLYVFEIK